MKAGYGHTESHSNSTVVQYTSKYIAFSILATFDVFKGSQCVAIAMLIALSNQGLYPIKSLWHNSPTQSLDSNRLSHAKNLNASALATKFSA